MDRTASYCWAAAATSKRNNYKQSITKTKVTNGCFKHGQCILDMADETLYRSGNSRKSYASLHYLDHQIRWRTWSPKVLIFQPFRLDGWKISTFKDQVLHLILLLVAKFPHFCWRENKLKSKVKQTSRKLLVDVRKNNQLMHVNVCKYNWCLLSFNHDYW